MRYAPPETLGREMRAAEQLVGEIDPERSRVRFVQAYESDSYRDVVRKTLDLKRLDGGWKILREAVEP